MMTNRKHSGLFRAEIKVTGRVQGVAFRWHTREQACKLGIVGSVRNLAEGSVDIIAEGERSALEALCDWASRGPDSASVDSREVVWAEAEGTFSNFQITVSILSKISTITTTSYITISPKCSLRICTYYSNCI